MVEGNGEVKWNHHQGDDEWSEKKHEMWREEEKGRRGEGERECSIPAAFDDH